MRRRIVVERVRNGTDNRHGDSPGPAGRLPTRGVTRSARLGSHQLFGDAAHHRAQQTDVVGLGVVVQPPQRILLTVASAYL